MYVCSLFSYKVSQSTLIQRVDFQRDQLSLSATFTAEGLSRLSRAPAAKYWPVDGAGLRHYEGFCERGGIMASGVGVTTLGCSHTWKWQVSQAEMVEESGGMDEEGGG